MRHVGGVKTSSQFRKIFSLFLKPALFLITLTTLSKPDLIYAQSMPYPQRSLWGSSAFAMGGAAAATFSGMDFFSLNPAGIAFYRGKSAAGGAYSLLPEDLDSWSLSVVDGVSAVNAGVQFKWTNFGESSRKQYQMAIAYPTSWGSFGVGVHSEQIKGVSGAGNGWHFTSSFGFLIQPGQGLAVGGSILSILDREEDSFYPPLLRLGASFHYPSTFRVAFDAFRKFNQAHQDWNYSTGLEIFWAEWLGTTAGYHFNHSDEKSFWSAGAFLRAPRVDLGATYHQYTDSSSSRGFTTELTVKF